MGENARDVSECGVRRNGDGKVAGEQVSKLWMRGRHARCEGGDATWG